MATEVRGSWCVCVCGGGGGSVETESLQRYDVSWYGGGKGGGEVQKQGNRKTERLLIPIIRPTTIR